MTNPTGIVYAENDIELSWPIGPGVVCDENQIRQRHYQSYRSSLLQNQS